MMPSTMGTITALNRGAVYMWFHTHTPEHTHAGTHTHTYTHTHAPFRRLIQVLPLQLSQKLQFLGEVGVSQKIHLVTDVGV